MGEAFAGKKVGKKAMLWGALAQSAPDIDFVASIWMNPPASLLAHRGFTHSFLFCLMLTPLLALTAERLHRPHNISLARWMVFFGGVIFVHVFIDAFNNYGVGWFEPFTHQRISFNAIYVADPFFSVWPGIAFGTLLLLGRYSPYRKRWCQIGLGVSALYLGYCLFNKSTTDTDVKRILEKQQIKYTQYLSTPAPLQNWLWFIAAGDENGYYIGYHSVFDSKDEMTFSYFPRNDSLLAPLKDNIELHQLTRFSQGFYTAEKRNDTLIFNDVRFGQVIGWHNPEERFAFHYYLGKGYDNRLVVQRGRFEKWDKNTVRSLIRKIKGN
jgi:inner membrane protein